MAERYWIYGIGIESDFVFPFAKSSRPGIAEIRLREWSKELHSPFSATSPEFFQRHHVADGSTFLRWPGLFEFAIDPSGTDVRCRKLGKSSIESFHTYLLGPVISHALLKHGIEQLHATVVAMEGRALALTGDCGRGKSTLAAALLNQGAKLLVDDMLVLQREPRSRSWVGFPGPPRLKLQPDAARRCKMNDAHAARMNPLVAKKVFRIPGAMQEPIALTKLYAISAPHPRRTRTTIHKYKPAEACIQVVAAAYNLDTEIAGRPAKHLPWAAEIANDIDVFKLSYPRDLRQLPRLAARVIESFLS